MADIRIGAYDDPALLPARQLQAETYVRAGYCDDKHVFNVDSATIEDPWLEQGIHFGYFEGGRPMGHARLLRPGPLPLPSSAFSLTAEPAWPRTYEVSALVVDREGGNSFRVAKSLYRAMLQESLRTKPTTWVAIVERPLLRVLTRHFGFPFEIIGEPREYMGTENYPVAVELKAVLDKLLDKRDPYYFEGAPFELFEPLAPATAVAELLAETVARPTSAATPDGRVETVT